jgi:hypothetical protein
MQENKQAIQYLYEKQEEILNTKRIFAASVFVQVAILNVEVSPT